MAKKQKPAAPILKAPATAYVAPVAAPVVPCVLVDARSGAYEAAIDEGSDEGSRVVRIGGQVYEHVSESADGRWIYRQS